MNYHKFMHELGINSYINISGFIRN